MFKILFSLILPIQIAFAQAPGQWDLLNLFEQFKATTPSIIKAYQLVKIPDAWQRVKNSPSINLNKVTVGIIDTGVDSGHPEFNDPKVNFGNTPTDALTDTPVAEDPRGHGTHVTGVIGANNVLDSDGSLSSGSPQMNGILSGALPTNLYSLEVRRFKSFIETNRNVVGFEKVTTVGKLSEVLGGMDADVTNLSIGWLKCSAFLGLNLPPLIGGCVKDENFNDVTNFFKEGFSSQPDTLFVISAGNENTDSFNSTPANIKLNNAIAIAAIDTDSEDQASFSNFGPGIGVAAPGTNVYAPAMRGLGNFPQEGGDYEFGGIFKHFSGTSASAPMVTGVAGLLKAIKPELRPEQIKQILIETGDPIQTDKPIGPRLNALKAVCHPSLGLNCPPPPAPSGTWTPAARMTTKRAEHTATLLLNGKVLVAGGQTVDGPEVGATASAELYDPKTNTFTPTGSMNLARRGHTATMLPNGKVLIAGGWDRIDPTPYNTAELYDPATGTFTPTGNMNTSRHWHTATLLRDGTVLIVGGEDGINVTLSSAELYNPQTNSFSPTGSMNLVRRFNAAEMLQDGRVLVTGGNGAGVGHPNIVTAEIYDPSTKTFGPLLNMLAPRLRHTATLFNTEVLVDGGISLTGAEIFNPRHLFSRVPQARQLKTDHSTTRFGLLTGMFFSLAACYSRSLLPERR